MFFMSRTRNIYVIDPVLFQLPLILLIHLPEKEEGNGRQDLGYLLTPTEGHCLSSGCFTLWYCSCLFLAGNALLSWIKVTLSNMLKSVTVRESPSCFSRTVLVKARDTVVVHLHCFVPWDTSCLPLVVNIPQALILLHTPLTLPRTPF